MRYIKTPVRLCRSQSGLWLARFYTTESNPTKKVVVIGGTGFIGPYIARSVLQDSPSATVQLACRSPRDHPQVSSSHGGRLLPSIAADVTDSQSVREACRGASAVVNLVGIMHERRPRYTFDAVQNEGARVIAQAAKDSGAKLVHVSAIGADVESEVPYARTKGLGEQAVLDVHPDASVVRPSLVFGKEDDFFNRFAKLARILPFVPVFGGGHTKFQPVYVEDLARAITQCIATDKVNGKIVEVGGPHVYEYRDLMQLMLDQAGIRRPIISVPWIVGYIQGFFLERLPENLFTLTRDQVKLLQRDNVVSGSHMTLADLGVSPTPAEDVLHRYLRRTRSGTGVRPPTPASTHSRSYFTSTRKPRIVETIAEYRALRHQWQRQDLSVGFVPTMGALHDGHVSLARTARKTCDIVVVSIFVNPAQFAPHEDLGKYPRTMEQDVAMLTEVGVDVIFLPNVKEMYPAGIVLDVKDQQGTFVEVKGKSHQMEGSIRPHFFRGVATVVTKFLNIMQPTKAFFGQKDAQQCAVVRTMVRDLFIPTEIVVGETVREPDGLAMSSRNRYLSPEERAIAPVLYKALSAGQRAFNEGTAKSRDELIQIAKAIIDVQHGAELEYLSVANPFSLAEEEQVGSEGAIFSGAVRVGKTRIIDNVLLGISTETWVK
ncbi:pantoate-beta-alanine ligase [Spizellomyces punctatus DAOM BR117]|uniref:Pantoate--beta-alanine ligase n=1 Tax=Spizellomyces punctatus (strain DAOM BR117) TaxID=645134 RepID=A0A0L0HE29_SPIPD|nr:pantoate-beta-alanine ligase [Spizellomyces punctatus DAOM BR117]KNC99018.1 pantoate-beta-alanine ligase [Spizellomyces punctatus DAOM BR117]|eukprot:XP_016607058.1 pantoate-beta-alanine ligase [Spizellomyces punctatus DAOM BR117]